LDVVGWITIDNESGKSFANARIKLMAGDVGKIQRSPRALDFAMRGGGGGGGGAPPVTEKTFDEYHLYTLERQTTLLDREKKQVEFVRAAGVKSAIIYVYDGAQIAAEQAGIRRASTLRPNMELSPTRKSRSCASSPIQRPTIWDCRCPKGA